MYRKIVRKNLEWPFQIYTSLFGKNCWEKFGMAIFGCSKFIPVFLGKIVRKNLDNFSVHTLIECNGLEINEIYANTYISLLYSVMVLKAMKNCLKKNCQEKHFCQKKSLEIFF